MLNQGKLPKCDGVPWQYGEILYFWGRQQAYLHSDPVAELNGDGFVNAADLEILKDMFFSGPGPSRINS